MSLRNRWTFVAALAATFALAAAPLGAATEVDIPFERFTLDNGLTVIVHEDRKAPIVSVNVWYHVGSKDEPTGKTGFAHLFEHLMFQGSENYPDEYFGPFEKVGATGQNGTTNADRTNYFQNVPTTALDMALWMESDRMGHFLGAVTEELLDEQRDVVKNEKRQGENQPYGRHVWTHLFEALYPEGHPYYRSTIGSMEDLDAASLEDVKEWFRTWYGPNNATLVLAGDIDVETARAKVQKYFGDIPPGPPLQRMKTWVAERDESTRSVMQDRVPQARVMRAWVVPPGTSVEADQLQGLAQVLGGSRTSRLDRRLVHGDKIADSVAAFLWGNELSGVFIVMADVKAGVDPATVETAIDEELAKLLAEGPEQDEVERARTVFTAGIIRGFERIGGFGGKSDVLAECQVYTGDPGCFRQTLRVIEETTPAELHAVAKRWLSKGDHTLTIVPYPQLAASGEGVDRSTGVPETTSFPDLRFPELQRGRLANGIEVVLAERHEIPVVQFSVEFPGGYAADIGRELGTSSFTTAMLDEGAGKYDALGFGAAAEALGANLGAGASLDAASAYLSAIKDQLDPSLELFATMIRDPNFDADELERVRQTWIAGIRQEKARPNAVAQRVLPPLLYGEGHPYAIPFTGSGTEASIAALTRDDLVAWHRDWIRPDNATILVVGDTTLAEVTELLNEHFGDWRAPRTPRPELALTEVERPDASRVFLIDQPGAIQATILIGQVVNSTMAEDAMAFDIANSTLGGEFTARLNMNLREDKSWAYGSYSFVSSARGQRPWIAFAPVQIDRTADALAELKREITEFSNGERPPSDEEIAKIKDNNVRGLPGSYETAGAVLGAISGIVRYERPDNYVETLKERTENLPESEIREAAGMLDASKLTWVIVGDLSKIEQPVRELGLGEVSILDADGQPIAR